MSSKTQLIILTLIGKVPFLGFFLDWKPKKKFKTSGEFFKALYVEYCKFMGDHVDVSSLEEFTNLCFLMTDLFCNLPVKRSFIENFARFANKVGTPNPLYHETNFAKHSFPRFLETYSNEAVSSPDHPVNIKHYKDLKGQEKALKEFDHDYLEVFLRVILAPYEPLHEIDKILADCHPKGGNVRHIKYTRMCSNRSSIKFPGMPSLVKRGFLHKDDTPENACYRAIIAAVSFGAGIYPSFLQNYQKGVKDIESIKVALLDLGYKFQDYMSLEDQINAIDPTLLTGSEGEVMANLRQRFLDKPRSFRKLQGVYLGSVMIGLVNHYRFFEFIEEDEAEFLDEFWGKHLEQDSFVPSKAITGYISKEKSRWSVENFTKVVEDRKIQKLIQGQVVKLFGFSAAKLLNRELVFECLRKYASRVVVCVSPYELNTKEVILVKQIFKYKEEVGEWLDIQKAESLVNDIKAFSCVETSDPFLEKPNCTQVKLKYHSATPEDFIG